MIGENEFSVVIRMDDIGAGESQHNVIAGEQECAALARRFDLVRLEALSAEIALSKGDGGIMASGMVTAKLVQACAATGDDVPSSMREPLHLIFIAEPTDDGEVELEEGECDTMFHDGRGVDIGEAAAQTMGLAINPYPRSKGAEAALRKAGVKNEEEEKIDSGPFAALAALKGQN